MAAAYDVLFRVKNATFSLNSIRRLPSLARCSAKGGKSAADRPSFSTFSFSKAEREKDLSFPEVPSQSSPIAQSVVLFALILPLMTLLDPSEDVDNIVLETNPR